MNVPKFGKRSDGFFAGYISEFADLLGRKGDMWQYDFPKADFLSFCLFNNYIIKCFNCFFNVF